MYNLTVLVDGKSVLEHEGIDLETCTLIIKQWCTGPDTEIRIIEYLD